MARHSRSKVFFLCIALSILFAASLTTSLLADKHIASSPRTVMVIDNTLGPIVAGDYPKDGKLHHDLQGFRRTQEGWRIVSVKGWLRPSPTDDPGSDLPYRVLSASDAVVQSIEIQIPPGSIEAQQNYEIQIVYESNAYFVKTDKVGRDEFRFPRDPENVPFILPKGHAVVGADFPLVMEEKDGRVQVMKENLTGEMPRDDRGFEITVMTRSVAN